MKKGVRPPIILPYSKSLNLQKLQSTIVQKESYIHLKGLYGSAKSFIIEKLFKENIHNILWILENKENASYHFNDIESLISNKQLYFLPSSYSRENNFKNTNSQNISVRTSAAVRERDVMCVQSSKRHSIERLPKTVKSIRDLDSTGLSWKADVRTNKIM